MPRSIRPAAVAGAIALALAFASAATAATAPRPPAHADMQSQRGGGGGHGDRHVVPAGPLVGGLLLAQWWREGVARSLDDPDNPLVNGGCVRYGPIALDYGGECTVPAGTWIFSVGFTTECSTVEDPPFHAETAREARECGLANDRKLTENTLSVDGGRPVDLRSGRFDAFMPFIRVVIPATPVLGGTPGEVMRLGGHGYVALVRPLPVGRHTLRLHVDGEIEGVPFPLDLETALTVTRRSR